MLTGVKLLSLVSSQRCSLKLQRQEWIQPFLEFPVSVEHPPRHPAPSKK